MIQTFEWDYHKALINKKAHNVSFEEAKSVYGDMFACIFEDIDHSVNENREIIIGFSEMNRLLTIVFTERNNNIRIISARKSTKKERNLYEKNSNL